MCAMKVGCSCWCTGWLRDVYGSAGAWPWWRILFAVPKRGVRLVAAKQCRPLFGIYVGVINLVDCFFVLFCFSVFGWGALSILFLQKKMLSALTP